MTVWCSRTWFSTEPSEYLVLPPLVAATSTASEMAMPRLPVLFGLRCQDRAAGVRAVRRAGRDGGAVGLHDGAAVRLLLVADLHHVDVDGDLEDVAGDGQRGAPLARAGLGGDALDAFLLVVVGLRQRPCSACGCRWG